MSSTRKLPSYHHLAVLSAASRTGMTSIQAVITELADVLELSPGSAKEPFTAPTFDLRRSNRLAALVRPFSPPPLALAGSPSLARPGSHRALHLQYNTHRKIMIRTKGIFHVGSKFHLDWVLVPLTT